MGGAGPNPAASVLAGLKSPDGEPAADRDRRCWPGARTSARRLYLRRRRAPGRSRREGPAASWAGRPQGLSPGFSPQMGPSCTTCTRTSDRGRGGDAPHGRGRAWDRRRPAVAQAGACCSTASLSRRSTFDAGRSYLAASSDDAAKQGRASSTLLIQDGEMRELCNGLRRVEGASCTSCDARTSAS